MELVLCHLYDLPGSAKGPRTRGHRPDSRLPQVPEHGAGGSAAGLEAAQSADHESRSGESDAFRPPGHALRPLPGGPTPTFTNRTWPARPAGCIGFVLPRPTPVDSRRVGRPRPRQQLLPLAPLGLCSFGRHWARRLAVWFALGIIAISSPPVEPAPPAASGRGPTGAESEAVAKANPTPATPSPASALSRRWLPAGTKGVSHVASVSTLLSESATQSLVIRSKPLWQNYVGQLLTALTLEPDQIERLTFSRSNPRTRLPPGSWPSN